MRKLLSVLGAVLLIAGEASGQSPCKSSSGTSTGLLQSLKVSLVWMDSTDNARVGLIKVDTSQVTLVSDSSVCHSALIAYRQVVMDSGSTAPTEAYVIQAGSSRLVVVHPEYGRGEWAVHIVLNASTYAVLGRFGG